MNINYFYLSRTRGDDRRGEARTVLTGDEGKEEEAGKREEEEEEAATEARRVGECAPEEKRRGKRRRPGGRRAKGDKEPGFIILRPKRRGQRGNDEKMEKSSKVRCQDNRGWAWEGLTSSYYRGRLITDESNFPSQ